MKIYTQSRGRWRPKFPSYYILHPVNPKDPTYLANVRRVYRSLRVEHGIGEERAREMICDMVSAMAGVSSRFHCPGRT